METVHSSAQTVWQSAPTLHNSVQTMCFTPAGAAAPDAGAPEPAEPAPPPVPLPTDKWEAVSFLAQRAEQAVTIEREIALLVDRRFTLMRRLIDSAKRKDETLAQTTATDWMKSEMKLAELWAQYQPFVVERQQTLKALGVAG